jgi:hypothetical protein
MLGPRTGTHRILRVIHGILDLLDAPTLARTGCNPIFNKLNFTLLLPRPWPPLPSHLSFTVYPGERIWSILKSNPIN